MLEWRRGLGETMAAMVLLLIASLAGVLLFTTSIQLSNEQGVILRNQYEANGKSARERFEIIFAQYDEAAGEISAWIYNYGDLDCEIIAIYVDEKTVSNQNPIEVVIKTGDITKITFEPENVPVSSYEITCISRRGVKVETNWSK